MYRGLRSLGRDVRGYDSDPARSPDSLEQTLEQEVSFLTLPTPVSADGQCDLSAIRCILEKASTLRTSSLLVLRSTVPVGTTEHFEKKFPSLNLGFSPELLRSATADADFLHPSLTIYGGKHPDQFFLALKDVCGTSETQRVMSVGEAEMAKLFLNGYATLKAVFASEMAELATRMKLDWSQVISAVEIDARVGSGYLAAIGPDGMPGVGGHCLPKDTRMLVEQLGPGSLLANALHQNAKLRAATGSTARLAYVRSARSPRQHKSGLSQFDSH
jgi:UDPglucose 6-dehydrogenase